MSGHISTLKTQIFAEVYKLAPAGFRSMAAAGRLSVICKSFIESE